MKIYMISVGICFLLFVKICLDSVEAEKGCKKQPIKERMKLGTAIGCLILAAVWPLVLLGAIMICFLDYIKAR